MNLQRINQLYENPELLAGNTGELESLRQLCRDYPYYARPYVILARHYYSTQHYKFDETLRQAALRVKDRKVLYDYIHGKTTTEETAIEVPVKAAEETVQASHPVVSAIPETIAEEKLGLQDFLEVIEEQPAVPETETPEQVHAEEFSAALEEIESAHSFHPHAEKPVEFEFSGLSDLELTAPEDQAQDIIGEEIQTEFSFSRNFNPPAEMAVPEAENLSAEADTPETKELETESAAEEETAPAIHEEPAAEIHIPEQETAPLPVESQEESGDHQIPDLSLRKYPVYNVEDFIGSEPEEQETEAISGPAVPEAETEDSSGGMDFLAWLSHPKPETEQATENHEPPAVSEDETPEEETSPLSGKTLDLIERFIQVNPQISRPKKEFFNAENMAKRSEVPDLEFVSETLANIYYEQGNYEMALKAYEKLSLQNPSKQAYFADLIEKIKSEKK